jgi:Bacterial mobilisation protein (MobC)
MSEAPDSRPKKAAPWRGRRRVKDPRAKFIAVRCSAEEYAAITKKAEHAGLSIGAFLRAQALGTPGPRAVRRPPVEKQELARILAQLGKIGSNVNQLTHAFNKTGAVPGFAELVAIRREIAEMSVAVMKALGRGPTH